jgi:hypothetical protein
MKRKKLAALMMIRTLTGQLLIILLKEAIPLNMKGVRSEDQYYLMQPICSY